MKVVRGVNTIGYQGKNPCVHNWACCECEYLFGIYVHPLPLPFVLYPPHIFFFQEVLTFPYFICFLQQEGVWELLMGFGNLMFPLWFGVLGGSFVFLDMSGSFHFVPCEFPLCFFLGALVYL